MRTPPRVSPAPGIDMIWAHVLRGTRARAARALSQDGNLDTPRDRRAPPVLAAEKSAHPTRELIALHATPVEAQHERILQMMPCRASWRTQSAGMFGARDVPAATLAAMQPGHSAGNNAAPQMQRALLAAGRARTSVENVRHGAHCAFLAEVVRTQRRSEGDDTLRNGASEGACDTHCATCLLAAEKRTVGQGTRSIRIGGQRVKNCRALHELPRGLR